MSWLPCRGYLAHLVAGGVALSLCLALSPPTQASLVLPAILGVTLTSSVLSSYSMHRRSGSTGTKMDGGTSQAHGHVLGQCP